MAKTDQPGTPPGGTPKEVQQSIDLGKENKATEAGAADAANPANLKPADAQALKDAGALNPPPAQQPGAPQPGNPGPLPEAQQQQADLMPKGMQDIMSQFAAAGIKDPEPEAARTETAEEEAARLHQERQTRYGQGYVVAKNKDGRQTVFTATGWANLANGKTTKDPVALRDGWEHVTQPPVLGDVQMKAE